jgi:hypothetical protein
VQILSFEIIREMSILLRICFLAGELRTPVYIFFHKHDTTLIYKLYKMNTSIKLLAVVYTILMIHLLFLS